MRELQSAPFECLARRPLLCFRQFEQRRANASTDLAQQFLEWLATDGQTTLVADNHEYPANPTVEAETLIRETFGTDFKRDPLRSDELGSLNDAAVRAMDAADFG